MTEQHDYVVCTECDRSPEHCGLVWCGAPRNHPSHTCYVPKSGSDTLPEKSEIELPELLPNEQDWDKSYGHDIGDIKDYPSFHCRERQLLAALTELRDTKRALELMCNDFNILEIHASQKFPSTVDDYLQAARLKRTQV